MARRGASPPASWRPASSPAARSVPISRVRPRPTRRTSPPIPCRKKTAAANITAGGTQRFVARADIPGEWWTLFHSAPLNALITDALKANPDLVAAQAALRKAQETEIAGEGAFLPSVTGSLQTTRQRASGAAFGEPNLSSLYTLYNASVSVSYTPDIFGATRRQVESLQAQADDQRFALEASYLSLTANVVTAAVQEASMRGQIAATQDIIKSERSQLDVVKQQFELGAAARSDVLLQEATLAQTEATLRRCRSSSTRPGPSSPPWPAGCRARISASNSPSTP